MSNPTDRILQGIQPTTYVNPFDEAIIVKGAWVIKGSRFPDSGYVFASASDRSEATVTFNAGWITQLVLNKDGSVGEGPRLQYEGCPLAAAVAYVEARIEKTEALKALYATF